MASRLLWSWANILSGAHQLALKWYEHHILQILVFQNMLRRKLLLVLDNADPTIATNATQTALVQSESAP
jgi:hypothetical protein